MNFKLEGGYFLLDEETQTLEPYLNMRIGQYIDSSKNREKVVVNQDIQGLGYTTITNFIDCNSGILTQHIPLIAYCRQMPMGLVYNLTELFTMARDPSSGVTSYEGLVQLPWSQGVSLHHFTSKSLNG